MFQKVAFVVILLLVAVNAACGQEEECLRPVASAKGWHNVGGGRWLVVDDPRPRLTLENYLPQVGDVILSVAKDRLTRDFFQLTTGSQVSHANIIVPHPEDGRPVVLDVNRKTKVRLVEVKEFLRERGEVIVRKRVTSLSKAQQEAMAEFAKTQLGKPYPADKKLLADVYNAIPVIPEVLDKVSAGQIERWRDCLAGRNKNWFCSQLVVATSQTASLINKKVNATAVVPADIFHAENPNWDNSQKLWKK